MIPPPIDTLINLRERLGKAKSDRIRYHQQGKKRRQPNSTNITNPHTELFVWFELYHYPALGDILTGVANSLDRDKPLSTSRLFNILKYMPVINAKEIQSMMGVGTRQAQYYLKACKLALPIVTRHLEKTNLPTAD